MRLFIAIHLPDPALDHLGKVQAALRTVIVDANFIRNLNLHLTLKFLGEVDEPRLQSLQEALERTTGGGAIGFQATGLILFPPSGDVRIVAAHVGGAGGEQLNLAQSVIDRATRGFGQPTEPKRFVPHITLARARNSLPAKLRLPMNGAVKSHFPGPTVSVRQFHLMQSEPSPTGSRYRLIRSFSL
jgi:2'-5' RNA ligase